MLINRESDYAIRIVRGLAHGEIRTVHEICTSEKLPKQFAYKILKKLERGKLVKVQRGAHGGYRLWKEISEITVYDILISVTEGISLNECLKEGHTCHHHSESLPCAIHMELKRLEEVMISALREKSMEKILRNIEV